MPENPELSGWEKFKQTLPEDQRQRIEEGGEYIAFGRSTPEPEHVVHVEPEMDETPVSEPQPRPTSLALARLRRAYQRLKHVEDE